MNLWRDRPGARRRMVERGRRHGGADEDSGSQVRLSGILPQLLRGLAVLAVVGRAAAAPGPVDAALRAELERVARRTVYFGHKSVGDNIMLGVGRLAAEAGVPLRILEVGETLPASDGPAFSHGAVAENRDPARKLESFARVLTSAPAPGLEVALLKFCFVDFDASTDVAALFARYQSAFSALRQKHPTTAFVHVTVPLTIVQGGPRAWVKRLLGRKPYGAVENARREEFNDLMRQAYRGREPFFDIALLESTGPDGKPELASVDGKPVPALVPAYTDDGGHLNRAGQLRAARQLISVLAAVEPPPRRTHFGSR